MRLIDADKLMDSLKGNVLIDVTPELEDTIAEQPTAFDKEKVIEELKKHADIAFETDDAYGSEVAYGEWTAYKQVEEIVEKGGIE